MRKGMVVSTVIAVILFVILISVVLALLLGKGNFFSMLLKMPAFIMASLISAILTAVGL